MIERIENDATNLIMNLTNLVDLNSSDSEMLFETINHTIKKVVKRELNNWIPVSEKLPTKRGHYLIKCPRSFPENYRGVIAEFYEDNQSFYGESSEDVHEDVTHWIELPNAD